MADVLIKGMSLPKGCGVCVLRHKDSVYDSKKQKSTWFEKCLGDGHCVKYKHQTKTDVLDRLHKGCPLVELPPHGEAKDTDIAIKYIKNEMEDDFNETTTLNEKSYKEGEIS